MNKLEMLIQTAEAQYESNSKIYCYHLSCSLLNIYKGRCKLFITNKDTNIREEILIKHDRAIMEGNLRLDNEFFNSLPIQFSNKSDKPAKVELYIEDKLNVSAQGVLFIDQEVKTKILSYQIFIPIF
tara:strand:+ start:1044 stop:1424 length:381 start_codon:yes stop_codon:yes gene_type:complete